MKNTQISNVGILVPKEIRLEVYKEALEIFKNNTKKSDLNTKSGLCLLLPCILWDLENFLDKAPDGKHWSYSDTGKRFPELTDNVIEDIEKCGEEEAIKKRTEYLEQFIKKLS